MTIDDVIADVLEREGGFVNDTHDRGGPTKYGVTADTLGRFRQLGRAATEAEVKALTEAEARDIYHQMYVRLPGFDQLPDWLLPIVVDDGVLSGTRTATKTLQQVLGVPEDGKLGPVTLHAVAVKDPAHVTRELVKARAIRFARIVQNNPSQARFLVGWLLRAFSFLT